MRMRTNLSVQRECWRRRHFILSLFEHLFDKKNKEDQRKVENILNNLYLSRLNFFLSTPTWLANFDHHSQIVHEKVFNFQSFAQRYDEWERWVKLKNSCSKTGHISLLLLLFASLCDATNISHSLVCTWKIKSIIISSGEFWIHSKLQLSSRNLHENEHNVFRRMPKLSPSCCSFSYSCFDGLPHISHRHIERRAKNLIICNKLYIDSSGTLCVVCLIFVDTWHI